MNIVYIIEGMFNSAGTERVLANKASYFAKKGHQVTVITTDQKQRPYFYQLPKEVTCIDLDINFLDYQKYPVLLRVFSYFYKSFILRKRLSALLLKIKPDVVVSLLLRGADFLYKIPDGSAKIFEHHLTYDHVEFLSNADKRNKFSRFIYNFRNKLVQKKLSKYDIFVVLTDEDAEAWKKKLDNVIAISNSISFQTEKIADPKNKIVLAVGRLEYQKGFDTLLEIWTKVTNKNPEWQLHIYGDGQEKEKLQSIIQQKGLSENVRIYPPTKNIEQVLLSSSIYVMSSRFEGFPMVLLEAMECGLPCVSFACKCGPRDMILDGENGFLIENNDIDTFVEKLNRLMQDKELRTKQGISAKQNIQRFSEQNVMKKWEDLFSKLTSKNG